MSREIDKKIAELKGLSEFPQLWDEWSTSIQDAWDNLFCELPEQYRSEVIERWRKSDFNPKDFIKIVCDVWIAWKETDHETKRV